MAGCVHSSHLRQICGALAVAAALAAEPAIVTVLSQGTAFAATIFVQPGTGTVKGPAEAAAVGDSIVLMPGRYLFSGGVLVPGGITITSSGGPLATVLDMQYKSPGFVFLNNVLPSTLDGLTLIHGTNISLIIGGGIYVYNSNPIIRHCLFTGNVVTDIDGEGGNGSAIGVVDGSPLVEHNTIVGNICGGGAISINGGNPIIRDNVIAYNMLRDSTSGWGITCGGGTGATIANNLFWRNVPSDLDGGCLPIAGSNPVQDPQFCQPAFYPADGFNGDWRAMASSGIAPGGALYGLGVDLGTCPGVPVRSMTWGKLKATYR